MKNIMASSLLGAVLIASAAPAFAFNEECKAMAKNTALLPVRGLALGAGLVVGTPIAVVRRSGAKSQEYTGTFADKIGGKEHGVPTLFASVLGVPFGLMAGTAEGVYYGGKNAFGNCVEHPFSKDSFSLGELE